ncbi:hypothetical protein PHYC_00484 [Phycisphaerales bacterium]|nr:hypothetical protein PHYC_00484 [Phycisphaerales bacterium]
MPKRKKPVNGSEHEEAEIPPEAKAKLADIEAFQESLKECTSIGDTAGLALNVEVQCFDAMWKAAGDYSERTPERMQKAEVPLRWMSLRLASVRAMAESLADVKMVATVGSAFGDYADAALTLAKAQLHAERVSKDGGLAFRRGPSLDALKMASKAHEKAQLRIWALAVAQGSTTNAIGGKRGDARRNPEPLTHRERAVLDYLKAIPSGEGRTGTKIIEALAALRKPIFMDNSTLTSAVMPRLKRNHNVRNRRGVGYYIESE